MYFHIKEELQANVLFMYVGILLYLLWRLVIHYICTLGFGYFIIFLKKKNPVMWAFDSPGPGDFKAVFIFFSGMNISRLFLLQSLVSPVVIFKNIFFQI